MIHSVIVWKDVIKQLCFVVLDVQCFRNDARCFVANFSGCLCSWSKGPIFRAFYICFCVVFLPWHCATSSWGCVLESSLAVSEDDLYQKFQLVFPACTVTHASDASHALESSSRSGSFYHKVDSTKHSTLTWIEWSTTDQIRTPTVYCKSVLALDTEHCFTGHLGVNKTYRHTLWHFCWRGLMWDVVQHCKSFHIF